LQLFTKLGNEFLDSLVLQNNVYVVVLCMDLGFIKYSLNISG